MLQQTNSAESPAQARELIAKSLAERGHKLVAHDELRRAPGLATGWLRFDEFLLSGGFPCGEISLLESPAGLGATTLWLDTARESQKNGNRAVWINPVGSSDASHRTTLNPATAEQRGLDLRKLLLVDLPLESEGFKKRLWILQEILTTRLFSLVGCDLGDVPLPLREGRSLLAQARRSGAAVVLLSRPSRKTSSHAASHLRTIASVALEFRHDHCRILRAPHRSVPQTFERRNRHVEFISGRTDHPSTGLNSRFSSGFGSGFSIDLRFALSSPASEHAVDEHSSSNRPQSEPSSRA